MKAVAIKKGQTGERAPDFTEMGTLRCDTCGEVFINNIYRIAVRRYAEVCCSDDAQHLGISQEAGRNVCSFPQRQTVIRFDPRGAVRESDLRALWVLRQG